MDHVVSYCVSGVPGASTCDRCTRFAFVLRDTGGQRLCDRCAEKRAYTCDGCSQFAIVLRDVDGGRLCDRCSEKSDQIDRLLATTRHDDPVYCDGCADRVAFDACITVVARENSEVRSVKTMFVYREPPRTAQVNP